MSASDATSKELAPRSADWLSVPEKGTLAGVLTVFWLATALGRRLVRPFVSLLALYYTLRDGKVREVIRELHTRIEGERPGFWRVFRHVETFAHVSLDRIFLLEGKTKGFTFTRDGNHYLEQLQATKTGVILLGAHVGSFEAMRLGGHEDELPLNIVGNFSNARMINHLLYRVSDHVAPKVIHAKPGDVGFVFMIQERVEKGEMVAILGDRVAEGQDSVVVEFLGRPARFPTGPFMLASLLGCPIYLTFGLYRAPDRYELSCAPFAEKVVLPRKRRQEALKEYVQQYAHELEKKVRAAPDNWFNFFDFWEDAS